MQSVSLVVAAWSSFAALSVEVRVYCIIRGLLFLLLWVTRLSPTGRVCNKDLGFHCIFASLVVATVEVWGSFVVLSD